MDKKEVEQMGELLEEIKQLNEHLADIKKMAASYLGWKIK